MIQKIFKVLQAYFVMFGINFKQIFRFVIGIPGFIYQWYKLSKQLKGDFPFGKLVPILSDKYESGGSATGHYFHQDIYVARKILAKNPQTHIDIGSRVDGFISHLAVFREVEIFDIRPITAKVKNLTFKQADLIQLPANLENYTNSISSLHAIEHFGLGRYGDPIDADGHLKAIKNITKILKPNGTFYFSTPIGKQRIEFNAHRVFSVQYLLDVFENDYEIVDFALVNDAGVINEQAQLSEENIKSNFNCRFGCAIFELRKK